MRAVPITMDGSQFHCVSQKSSPMSAIDGDLSYRSLAYFLLSYVAYNNQSSITPQFSLPRPLPLRIALSDHLQLLSAWRHRLLVIVRQSQRPPCLCLYLLDSRSRMERLQHRLAILTIKPEYSQRRDQRGWPSPW